MVVIDRAGALAHQRSDASATDGKIAPRHLWIGACLAINEFRVWLLSHGWAEAHMDEFLAAAKRATPTDTAGDSLSEWTLDLLRGGMADILDVLSRIGGIDVEEFSKRLLKEFDAAVDACSTASWVRSLDSSTPPFELPLVNHRDGPTPGGLDWRQVDRRWIEMHHEQEELEEIRHLEATTEQHWDELKEAYLLIVPALLGYAYRATSEESVPQRYYWTFVTGYPRAWIPAQSIFYKSLNPNQTAVVLRRGFRSWREDDFSERAWRFPEAAPRLLYLMTEDDEVVLRRLHTRDFRWFGPSHGLLAALIVTEEQLFLKLGRLPFKFDDNRLHLDSLRILSSTIFDVAEDLERPTIGRASG